MADGTCTANQEVLRGLSSTPRGIALTEPIAKPRKDIGPWWLYDAIGAKPFWAITPPWTPTA